VRFGPACDELNAMIADKSTTDVLIELRSLVQSRLFLLALVEKETGPESDKAAAVANYEREIAALNAAIEALAVRHDRQADRTIKLISTGKCAPRSNTG
jgi:hypothetical protein